MTDVIIRIDDDLCSSASSAICRICHEEDFKSLESPCACSGTVKFAHRDCIQRWCNEKGDTTCEICLQKFEPGYICPPKKTQPIDTAVTIRGSLEIPRNDEELENEDIRELDDESEADTTSGSWFRSVALIFTALLLIRHLFAVLTGETETYPFSILTVIIARASGILLPMYILTQIVAAFYKNIKQHNHHYQSPDERQ